MPGHRSSGELVVEFIRAIEARDLDHALSMVTDDVEYENVPIGVVHGPDGIRQVLTAGVLAGADRLEWVIKRQADQGDVVFNERLDRFHLGDAWIEVAVAGVFVLRDGRISLWRDYFDLETVAAQLRRPDEASATAEGSGRQVQGRSAGGHP